MKAIGGPGALRRTSSSLLRSLRESVIQSTMAAEKVVKNEQPQTHALIRLGVLFLMVAQNATVVIVMRMSRHPSRREALPEGSPLYFASVVIVCQELGKLLMCLLILTAQQQGNVIAAVRKLIAESPMDTMMRLAIPSLMYLLQNSLVYVAIQNLTASTYQITYQLKLLLTALLTSTVFNRPLSATQWLSVTALFLGVCAVQMSGGSSGGVTSDGQHRVLGLVAAAGASFCSACASVYVEAVMKGAPITLCKGKSSTASTSTSAKPGPELSMWTRNVQLAAWSLLFAAATAWRKDGEAFAEYGIWHGFDGIVWCVVLLQAFGGLIVAATLKYADNILKGFATSTALVVTGFVDALFFGEAVDPAFVVGATIVIAALWGYSFQRDYVGELCCGGGSKHAKA